MKHFFLFLSMQWFVLNGFAQDFSVSQISVYDLTTKAPIEAAEVKFVCETASQSIKTNSLGFVTFSCKSANQIVEIKADFYKSTPPFKLSARKAVKKGQDTIYYEFFLEPKMTKTTAEVEIVNPYKPQAIFSSERISVADFEILSNGNMVILAYERRQNKGAELLLVDEDQKVLFSKTLGKDTKNLVTDFRGFLHLLYERKIDHVFVTEDYFDLVGMEKAYYDRYVAPIIDTTGSKYYFSNGRPTFPASDFFVYDELDSTYQIISRVSDEIIMDMYMKEYLWVDTRTKLLARDLEQRTGVPKEEIVGEAYFTKSIFYKPIYAPFFLKNETLYLFDFYKDYLFRFDKSGKKIDSLSIDMHKDPKKTGWSNHLIQDAYTGDIYAIFDLAGYTVIRGIDLNTGQLGPAIRLEYRYIEKLIIQDNRVYYTYRPFESIQKKYLYTQLLPNYSGENQTAKDQRR